MTDLWRFLRLGVINVFGITVPGLCLILFLSAGFFFPLIICIVPLCQGLMGSDNCINWEQVASFWMSNKIPSFFLIVILAYIAGYIIRLSDIDKLDEKSAKMVIKKMEEEAENKRGSTAKDDCWPFQDNELDNKYPYFHFKDYLRSGGLKECENLVKWGKPNSTFLKRSKTHVNMMKLEVVTKSPELSAIIESNEAHVRLMFGTWCAIKTAWRFVIVGIILSTLGLVALMVMRVLHAHHQVSPPYGMSLLISVAIIIAMSWAKKTIEHLFHYQRVRELFHIVACLHYTRSVGKAKVDHPNWEEADRKHAR